ncbi:hypothetical protein EHP00_1188 [Ecytonucleospora hepatopenaei]|uniref:Uncharacterized protein n=1 Tax=Ecytonucleospora hepatopenaei TaxID=646526 RepID=A0A1W0E862_9MICR|nr:hypothetical protein EHP00_1188 [Ecytonucleospora hepatopenaei]
MKNLEKYISDLESFLQNITFLDEHLKNNYVLQITKMESKRNTVLLQLFDCKSKLLALNF